MKYVLYLLVAMGSSLVLLDANDAHAFPGIKFGPVKPPPPPPLPYPLQGRPPAESGSSDPDVHTARIAGTWRDSNRQLIRITQDGSSVRADAGFYRHWAYADGSLNGNSIYMKHFNGARQPTAVVNGVVRGNRIDWNNGTSWYRQ